MADRLTLTSATCIYSITIDQVYTSPQTLQGFGVNEAFATDAAETAEVQLGVDGIMAAGWLPRVTPQTITLMATSPSFIVFEDWVAAMDAAQEILYADAVITIPGIKRKYTLSQGALTRYPALPNARRTLEQRQFVIAWAPGIIAAPA